MDDYIVGQSVHLPGYTSTSKDMSQALNFAFDYLKDDQIPVILEITFKGNSGLFELTEGYSAYPEENEILLQDGLKYKIISKEELDIYDTNDKFTLI